MKFCFIINHHQGDLNSTKQSWTQEQQKIKQEQQRRSAPPLCSVELVIVLLITGIAQLLLRQSARSFSTAAIVGWNYIESGKRRLCLGWLLSKYFGWRNCVPLGLVCQRSSAIASTFLCHRLCYFEIACFGSNCLLTSYLVDCLST